MNDKKEVTDPPRVTLDPQHLAGAIELTPEARAILTKHVNRRIVWGYKITKTVLQTLALSPLLVTVFYLIIGTSLAIASVQGFVAVALFAGVPALIAFWLFRLASRL